MILALDHLIFGNGFGMASPYHDARYYWLVRHVPAGEGRQSGCLVPVEWLVWAQLRSIQWTHPRAGERSRLASREFVMFNSTRRWFRVEVTWALVDLPKDITEANAVLHQLERDLGRG